MAEANVKSDPKAAPKAPEAKAVQVSKLKDFVDRIEAELKKLEHEPAALWAEFKKLKAHVESKL